MIKTREFEESVPHKSFPDTLWQILFYEYSTRRFVTNTPPLSLKNHSYVWLLSLRVIIEKPTDAKHLRLTKPASRPLLSVLWHKRFFACGKVRGCEQREP